MDPMRVMAIMSGEDRTLAGRLARVGLSCASPIYRGAIALRNAIFDGGLRKQAQLARPVISVGNLTTGGTGKTPMVIELARRLLAMGAKPGILTRGYRGRTKGDGLGESTSDEVELFHREFGDTVPVEANANRAAGAESMLAKRGEVSVFLLDDGFQHRQVFRDLDIVLIDATQPFGFGRLLPRGLLREPVKNVWRADVIIITRSNEVAASRLDEIAGECAASGSIGDTPLLIRAEQCWNAMKQSDGSQVDVNQLRALPILAFTGIGNPIAFEAMLRRHAEDVRAVHVFPDHHDFSEAEIRSLIDRARANGAKALVATEKDWTKIHSLIDWSAVPLPLFRPVLQIEFPVAQQWLALAEKLRNILP